MGDVLDGLGAIYNGFLGEEEEGRAAQLLNYKNHFIRENLQEIY